MTIIAKWNGAIIAQSDATVIVEGNHYFPMGDVKSDMLIPSETKTHCPWKGDASYFSLSVDGQINHDAAWYYPAPKAAASEIQDRIAFWKGVEISDN